MGKSNPSMITSQQLVNGGNNIDSTLKGTSFPSDGNLTHQLPPQPTPLQLEVPQGVFGSQTHNVPPIRQYSILPPISKLTHNAIDSFSNSAVSGAVLPLVSAVSDTNVPIGDIISENIQTYTPQVSIEPSYNQEIPSARKIVFPPRQSVNRRPKWNSNF